MNYEPLPWESGVLGRQVGLIRTERRTTEDMSQAVRHCMTIGLGGLFMLVSADDDLCIIWAESHGFRLVDVRVELSCPLEGNFAGVGEVERIREWQESDLDRLTSIARSSHKDGRVFHDPDITHDQADAWYENWILSSCRGYADRVWVIDDHGMAAGYLSVHLDPGNRGRIGLFAVGEGARGQGLGSALIRHSLSWFARRNCESVSVVTQGRNRAALRVYQKCGFHAEALKLWYHKWFPQS